jgi:hypothetical protein
VLGWARGSRERWGHGGVMWQFSLVVEKNGRGKGDGGAEGGREVGLGFGRKDEGEGEESKWPRRGCGGALVVEDHSHAASVR